MYELEMAKKIRELEKEIQYLKTLEKAKAMVPPSDYVDLTTDQNIGGVKGFTSFPLTPSSAPVNDYQVANKKYVDGKIVFLTEPLTSTDWDGDSYSTIGKTKIDLNTVFGTPPNTKAVLVWYGVRDSASSTFDANLELSPNAVLPAGMSVGCSGLVDNKWMRGMVVVPCDEDGNIYYRITASGTNTMQVYLQIWGYWL